MKKISIALMLALVATAISFGQEFTVYCSGETQGYITITKDAKAKITIHCKLTKGYVLLSKEICPILQNDVTDSLGVSVENIVIGGNTTTETRSNGSWRKTVIDGNTTTETHSDGFWQKTVVEGNTATKSNSYGTSFKIVVEGNTTTRTNSSSPGYWEKTIVDGNTTTDISSTGFKFVTVVDGNTTSMSHPDGTLKTVVTKEGSDIYIHTTGQRWSM
ncbi:MAG: hypothetical protein LBT01_09660 [Spirochaetaceae bacterium]|jgi:hypothetical protein|nr:hypothetical protein [Spirochaetaceae bacterium]